MRQCSVVDFEFRFYFDINFHWGVVIDFLFI